jgi:predicted AAA+ superfamily ATPase
MYKRKIESFLLDWKNTPNHKPLVIKGCRQCGKTSSVVAFAKKHYKYVIYIDFHEQEQLCTLFAGSLSVDYLTMTISASVPGAQFVPHNTCLVLDEIQNCPRARSSLKFFMQDGRYDVICTGSLLGVSGYKNAEMIKAEDQATIPVGAETIVEMYPMDFEEWLWANGINEQVFDFLRKSLQEETPITADIHQRLRQLLLEYVVVGGMPEAVKTFFATHDMNQVCQVQRHILNGYRDDMIKYARSEDKPRIRECFDSIPRQLSRDNKKFTYSLVRKGGRSKEYISCLQWIEDAGIVRRCYNLMLPELPLNGNSIQDCFKVYMADTGLLVSMLDDGTQGDILQGNLWTYKGAVYENLVADILGKMGRKLYYYQKESGLEIDFVMRYKGECTLLECKANTGNAKSVKTILNHPDKYHVNAAIKLGDYNIGRSEQLLTLPLYMAFLLSNL